MKKPWWMAICITALLAIAGNAAPAQDHGQDRPDRNDRVNRARNNTSRNRHSRATFNDQNRKATRDWHYQYHDRAPAGLRYQDRLSADEELRLQIGSPLDADLRKKVSPAPMGLWDRLAPSPRNYHYYVAIGGNVVAIDDKYQNINDLIHLEFNF